MNEDKTKLRNYILSLLEQALAEVPDDAADIIAQMIENTPTDANPYRYILVYLTLRYGIEIAATGMFEDSTVTIDTSKVPAALLGYMDAWRSLSDEWDKRNGDGDDAFFITKGNNYYQQIVATEYGWQSM